MNNAYDFVINNGILENEIIDEYKTTQRYWIHLR